MQNKLCRVGWVERHEVSIHSELSPQAYGYGSCSAWATFVSYAARAVGVPARQVSVRLRSPPPTHPHWFSLHASSGRNPVLERGRVCGSGARQPERHALLDRRWGRGRTVSRVGAGVVYAWGLGCSRLVGPIGCVACVLASCLNQHMMLQVARRPPRVGERSSTTTGWSFGTTRLSSGSTCSERCDVISECGFGRSYRILLLLVNLKP